MNEISELEHLFDTLWPLNRSLTGNAVRETHSELGKYIPLNTYEVSSGTKVYDWTVPDEWNCSEGYIVCPDGSVICDVTINNLHVVGYSTSIDIKLDLIELKKNLFYLDEIPDAIPYKTSYYKRDWGFCITKEQFDGLQDGIYHAVINSTLEPGSLTISECVIEGRTEEEILIHTYTCHPSMAINELSGVLAAFRLAQILKSQSANRYTYRIVFAPETIGAIAYINMRESELKKNLRAGLVCTCVGHNSSFTYKNSRKGNALIDRAVKLYFKQQKVSLDQREFGPSGSDERQYCSIGIDLPVGSLMRTPYHEYPEYHTSKDDKSIIDFSAVHDTAETYSEIFKIIEKNNVYLSTVTKCEPFMSRYPGLYYSNGLRFASDFTKAVKWLIHFSDGQCDLISLSHKSGIPVIDLHSIATILVENGLLMEKEK